MSEKKTALLVSTHECYVDGQPLLVCPHRSAERLNNCTVSASYGGRGMYVEHNDLKVPLLLDAVPTLWGDPSPGFPKTLVLRIATRGAAPDSSPTTITVVLHENGCRFVQPMYLHPFSTLRVMVVGGLANQLYCVMMGVLTAVRTRRKFVFPPRLLARRTTDDVVSMIDAPAPDVDVPFSALLDANTFVKQAPVALFVQNDALCERCQLSCDATPDFESKHSSVSLATHSSLPLTTKSTRSPSGVPHKKKDPGYIMLYKGAACTPSSTIATDYLVTDQHVTLPFPMGHIAPDTADDFKICMDTLAALRAAPRLGEIAKAFADTLPRDCLCVHVRAESDWVAAGRAVAGPQFLATEIRAYTAAQQKLRTDIYVPRDAPKRTSKAPVRGTDCKSKFSTSGEGPTESVVDIESVVDTESVVVVDSVTKPPPRCVYVIGQTTHRREYWTALQTALFPDFLLRTKDDFLAERGVSLGFEEAAVFDREVGVTAPDFLGMSYSTLSLIIVLERQQARRKWRLYTVKSTENSSTDPGYLFSRGAPLFSD
jgi:hypothetical protein